MSVPMTAPLERPWLYSALVVTVLRFVHAADPGYDLSLQILAGHNLLAGLGLSIFEAPLGDLAAAARAVTLTHFPAGYSLLVAALVAAGLPDALVVKIPAMTATLLGWWGWGRLSRPFFEDVAGRGRIWRWMALLAAALTPVVYTPRWGGTDLFLWACVPWVILLLARAGAAQGSRWSLDLASGAICGFAVMMRYASVILAGFAGLVIVWQCRRRPLDLVRRGAAFAAGVAPAFLVQLYVVLGLADSATPGGLSLDGPHWSVTGRLLEGLQLLHVSNVTWLFWVPGRVLGRVIPAMPLGWGWHIAVTALAVAALAAILISYRRERLELARDPRAIATILFLVLPAGLMACMLLGTYNYVGDTRYYRPVVPLAMLAAFSLAGLTGSSHGWWRVLGGGAAVYVAGFLAACFVYIALMATDTPLGATQRHKLLGSTMHEWAPLRVAHEFSPARQFVIELLEDRPDAILLSSRLQWFAWDPTIDRSRVYRLTCDGASSHVSGPATIVMLTFDEGRPEDLWEFIGIETGGAHVPVDCLERLGANVLGRFPDEGLKVLEARVPPGTQASLVAGP